MPNTGQVGQKLRVVWVTTVTVNDTTNIAPTLRLLSAIARSLRERFHSSELINWMVVEEGRLTGSISQLPRVAVNMMHLMAEADSNGGESGDRLCRRRAIERLRQFWTEEEDLPPTHRAVVAVVLTRGLEPIPDKCLSSSTRRVMHRAADDDRPIRLCDSFAVVVSAQYILSNRLTDTFLRQLFH